MSKENENKKVEAEVEGTNVQVNAEVKDVKEETKTAEKTAEKEKKPGKVLGFLKKAGKWAWTGLVTAGAVGGTVLGVSNMIHMKNIQNPRVPTVPGPDAGNTAIGTTGATGIGTGTGVPDTASNNTFGTDVF